MIIDIPTSNDFTKSGEEHLNNAWEQVISLLLNLIEIRLIVPEGELSKEDEDKYWECARQAVAMSVASVQHGVEAILKGRIVAMSPYLLLAGAPSSWPRGCDRQDISFAEFRTVDAQDLLKLHDAISLSPFDEAFRVWFDGVRKKRNRVIHSVGAKLQVTFQEAICNVLEAHEQLFGESGWLDCRRRHLVNSPDYSIRYLNDGSLDGYIAYALARELRAAVSAVSGENSRRFFGYIEERENESFHCPACMELWEKREYHDSRDLDDVLKTFQPCGEGVFRCALCGYCCAPLKVICEEEGDVQFFDKSHGRCLSCGLMT